jgi:imidazolonepropionase-like amidohydrolase
MVPGVDLHNELALLVEAGFTPMEALQAATIKLAEFLGKRDSLGTIEPRKTADLVLLDANPLEDISHTRKINAVVLGGKFLPIAAISARVLQEAAEPK